jgi:hypothetical protein
MVLSWLYLACMHGVCAWQPTLRSTDDAGVTTSIPSANRPTPADGGGQAPFLSGAIMLSQNRYAPLQGLTADAEESAEKRGSSRTGGVCRSMQRAINQTA